VIWSTFSRGATNAISSTFLIRQHGAIGALGQHKRSVFVKINMAIFATQFVLRCAEGVELMAVPLREYFGIVERVRAMYDRE